MAKVRELVDRWLDERVEIDSGAVMNTNDGWDDFFEWLKEQEDWGGPVYAPQWGSAMKQRGFRQERDGGDWIIRGIKLKGD